MATARAGWQTAESGVEPNYSSPWRAGLRKIRRRHLHVAHPNTMKGGALRRARNRRHRTGLNRIR
jgi:hypothetical protein